MLKSIYKPFYGFTGIGSRINGIIIRSLALVIGTLILVGLLMFGILSYLGIVLGPFLFLKDNPLQILILVSLMVLAKSYYYFVSPIGEINDPTNIDQYWGAGDHKIRDVLSHIRRGDMDALYVYIENNSELQEFIQRSELSYKNVIEFVRINYPNVNPNEFFDSIIALNSKIKLKYVTSELIFTALFVKLNNCEDFLKNNQLSSEEFTGALDLMRVLRMRIPYVWEKNFVLPPAGGVDKAWAASFTPVLNRSGTDLTKLGLKGLLPRRVGREKVRDEVINILTKPSRNNVMIIGESGSGKTTFVHALAREIATGTKIKTLQYKRIFSLDMGCLTSGSPGEINERMSKIIKEIETAGNVILFVDEIHNISSVLNKDPNAVSVFSALEPHISSGKFQFIGTTSYDNYAKYIAPNDSFAKAFDIVKLPETNDAETLEILEEETKKLEARYQIKVSYPALLKCILLAKKYVHHRAMPDKAVEVLTQAFSGVVNKNKLFVLRSDIDTVVSDSTGIPVNAVDIDEKNTLLNLDKILHSRIIGQDQAVIAIAKALKRARVGVRNEDKPIASFLFVGPTGVGKTETAKALADIYFRSASSMIRLDMSEYQTADSISRFIGSQNGDIGQLTSKIQENPYSLVLLDEIEKADKNILNLFLQVLDDGRLTNSLGVTVDFTNAIIIMTSNVGTREIIKAILRNLSPEEVRKVAIDELKNRFPPEFLNRFTDLIPFSPLTNDELEAITRLKLKSIKSKLLKKQIEIEFTDQVIKKISEKGYSQEWGARSLNRVIEGLVETKIADLILQDKLKTGDKYIFDSID